MTLSSIRTQLTEEPSVRRLAPSASASGDFRNNGRINASRIIGWFAGRASAILAYHRTAAVAADFFADTCFQGCCAGSSSLLRCWLATGRDAIKPGYFSDGLWALNERFARNSPPVTST